MAQDNDFLNDFLEKAAMSAEARKLHAYNKRMCAARNAPKSNTETRLALFIAERGITEAELKPFYKARRKGAKSRFDYFGFADKYDIDRDWLLDGDLDGRLRIAKRQPRPRTVSSKIARAQKREIEESLLMIPAQYRHEVLAYVRGLADRLLAQAMGTVDGK